MSYPCRAEGLGKYDKSIKSTGDISMLSFIYMIEVGSILDEKNNNLSMVLIG